MSSSSLQRIFIVPSSWATDTEGNLLGEIEISSPEVARDYAVQCQKEALAIWKEPKSNWEVMRSDNTSSTGTSSEDGLGGLVVEARRVTRGPLASSGLLLTRASHSISTSISTETVYQLLISPEGFAMIDPVSDPKDFEKYLEKYDYPSGGRLEVAEAHAKLLPCIATRDFCVLNCFDHCKRLFTSKSIVHAKLPGASRFYKPEQQQQEHSSSSSTAPPSNICHFSDTRAVRALNTFAFVVEKSGDNKITLQWINWIDLGFPTSLMNWIACKQTFPHIIGKLQRKLAEMEARKQE